MEIKLSEEKIESTSPHELISFRNEGFQNLDQVFI